MGYIVTIARPPLPSDLIKAWQWIEEQGEDKVDAPPQVYLELINQLTDTYPYHCDGKAIQGVWSDGPSINNITVKALTLGVICTKVEEVIPFLIKTANALGLSVFDWENDIIHKPIIFPIGLLMRLFSRPQFEYFGSGLSNVDNVKIGDLCEIESADISRYGTCRGATSAAQIDSNFELILNLSANENLRDNAIEDCLWDELMHQYTLFSATPIALYRLLKRSTIDQRSKVPEIIDFIKTCSDMGTQNIFMTTDEIMANARGELPIYSIEEIIKAFA